MKSFRDYWTFSAIRGAMTILAAVAIVGLPLAAAPMLGIPVMLTLAIDCLAAYCLFDGAVMLLLARLMPEHRRAGLALSAQAAMSVPLAAAFFLMAYGVISPRGVLLIAAVHAAFAGAAEWAVARETYREYACLSCFATSGVLALCAVALPFAQGAGVTGTAIVLAGYIALYGASQMVEGGRMLFVEYRSEHPAAVASEAWRSAMDRGAVEQAAEIRPRFGAAILTPVPAKSKECAECAAADLCHNGSARGQAALISARRGPAIVNSVRLAGMLKSA